MQRIDDKDESTAQELPSIPTGATAPAVFVHTGPATRCDSAMANLWRDRREEVVAMGVEKGFLVLTTEEER